MSEYQYYEFLAVDRLLDRQAQAKLRDISSRAKITATSFSNHYEWGSLKADPLKMLAEHFDVHVYVANWQSRTFAMRLPRKLVDRAAIERFGIIDELLSVRENGESVVVAVTIDEVEMDEWDEGTSWMADLAPLRAAVLRGDLRLFYVLWLLQVSFLDVVPDDVREPLPGIGAPDVALDAFARFIGLDEDLLSAAQSDRGGPAVPSPRAVEAAIRVLNEDEKVALLMKLHAGDDPHLSTLLRARLALTNGADAGPRRTSGALRQAAELAGTEREAADAARAAEAKRQSEAKEAKARAERVAALGRRGTGVWRELEVLIGQRNAKGYKQAVEMLVDLRELGGDFAARVGGLRRRHASKRTFIERLDEAGLV